MCWDGVGNPRVFDAAFDHVDDVITGHGVRGKCFCLSVRRGEEWVVPSVIGITHNSPLNDCSHRLNCLGESCEIEGGRYWIIPK